MLKRLVLITLVTVVGCKGQEGTPDPAGATPNSAASAGLAAAALAQALASAAGTHAAATGTAAATAAASALAAPSASAVASATAATDAVSTQLANELGRLGFSTGANDLLALGRDRGALLGGLGRLAGHPSALSAIFNNDKVVSAFSKRADFQSSCHDEEQLKQKLLFALSSPGARALVADPASLKALTSSKLGVELQACPAFQSLMKKSHSLADITHDSPAASAIVNNANFRAELDRLKIHQDTQPTRTFARRK